MSPEAQRIAIAEACGHTNIIRRETCNDHGLSFDLTSDESYGYNDAIPDYINDLNAMHEAEMTLSRDQLEEYGTLLRGPNDETVSLWSPEHKEIAAVAMATAEQRAEAFLRTIGKWQDSNVT